MRKIEHMFDQPSPQHPESGDVGRVSDFDEVLTYVRWEHWHRPGVAEKQAPVSDPKVGDSVPQQALFPGLKPPRKRHRRSSGALSPDRVEAGSVELASAVELVAGERFRVMWAAQMPGWVDPGWYDAPIRAEVRLLLTMELGPQLLHALTKLPTGRCPDDHSDLGFADLPLPGSAPGWACACQVVVHTAWEAMVSWTQTQVSATVVDIAGQQPVRAPMFGPLAGSDETQFVTDPVCEELALGVRLSPQSMSNRLHQARSLQTYPRLVGLVVGGHCSMWVAKLMLSEVDTLNPEAAAAVIEDMVTRILERHQKGLRQWTCGEVTKATKKARLRLDPDLNDEARKTAVRGRKVEIFAGKDGMASVYAVVEAAQAHRIFNRLTAQAKAIKTDDPTDRRCRDEIRADLVVDALLPTQDPMPTSQNIGAAVAVVGTEINVTVDLATLLNLANHPAELAGVGPIPADVAREIAADGSWKAWITAATKAGTQVVAVSPNTYTPTAGLARLIRAKEPTCRMPGCRTPSQACDLDHTIPWPHGATTGDNMGPLCRRHHNLKTHQGWQLTNHETDTDFRPNHSYEWTTPAGITHRC